MANYRSIERQISRGRGKAAKRLGQPFTVYRFTDRGFFEITPTIRCFPRRISRGNEVEQRIFPSQVYRLTMDRRGLELGDLLVEHPLAQYAQAGKETTVTDKDVNGISMVEPVTQKVQNAYLFAQARPIHSYVGIRMEFFCQVRRPVFSSMDGDGGYQEQGENSESVLVLPQAGPDLQFVDVNSNFEGAPPKPFLIPFQLEIAYVRGTPPFDLPVDWGENKWHYACPAKWGGLLLRENDQIIHPDGNRFPIQSVQENVIGTEVVQGVALKKES